MLAAIHAQGERVSRMCILAIEGIQRTGRRVSGIKTLHFSPSSRRYHYLVTPSVRLLYAHLLTSARVCRCCREERGTRYRLAANRVASRSASCDGARKIAAFDDHCKLSNLRRSIRARRFVCRTGSR